MYYNAGGGCFGGECIVNVENRGEVKIKELRKGDILEN
jgi:hypothetical protein